MNNQSLFDCLHECVRTRGVRDIREAEELALIPSAIYYAEQLKRSSDERRAYFLGMFEKFTETDLIFFDPDKGIEVRSVKSGSKKSPEYLSWNKLKEAFARGHSVLIYQHFPHENNRQFVTRITDEIRKSTDAKQIDAFITSKVVFFLASQEKHQMVRRNLVEKVEERWHGQIRVENSVTE